MSVDAVTRQEMYLQYLSGDTSISLPEPVTRIEKYWWDIAKRIEDFGDLAQGNKLAIESIGKTLSSGTAGQFATSDGKGGITWLTVVDGNEVAF